MHGSNAAAEKAEGSHRERYRDALLQRVAAGRLNLPLLPQAAGKLLSLVHDSNVDRVDLSGLIHRDQALAGHVLRVVNSAVYGTGETIVSLQQAMTYLGDRLAFWTLSTDALSEVALLNDAVFDVLNFYAEERETLLGIRPAVVGAVATMDL